MLNIFSECSKLQKLDIPASVEYIYQEAFSGCNSIKEIIARPETPPFVYNNTFSNYNCTLKVPDAGKDAYAAHETWSKFGTIQTISGEDIEKNKCAVPTISYADGKLTFNCETEGVEYRSTITDSDISSYTTARYNSRLLTKLVFMPRRLVMRTLTLLLLRWYGAQPALLRPQARHRPDRLPSILLY